MAFCATCGASVEGRFCAKCGSSVVSGGASPAAGNSGTAAPPAAAGAPMADNVASALCYVLGLITGIIFLVIQPYNRNRTVRFHAFQAIFMHVAMIALYIVLGIVFGIMINILPFSLIALMWPVIGLGFFGLWLFLIISAYQGKQVELPVIGPFARQQAG
jgi:uncharacterized membrane protein